MGGKPLFVVNLHGFGGGIFYNGIIRFLNQRVHGEQLFMGLLFLCFQVIFGEAGDSAEGMKVMILHNF